MKILVFLMFLLSSNLYAFDDYFAGVQQKGGKISFQFSQMNIFNDSSDLWRTGIGHARWIGGEQFGITTSTFGGRPLFRDKHGVITLDFGNTDVNLTTKSDRNYYTLYPGIGFGFYGGEKGAYSIQFTARTGANISSIQDKKLLKPNTTGYYGYSTVVSSEHIDMFYNKAYFKYGELIDYGVKLKNLFYFKIEDRQYTYFTNKSYILGLSVSF